MMIVKGISRSAALDDESLTIITGKSRRVLPLHSIESIEYVPSAKLQNGYIRAILTADPTLPGLPAVDPNTVHYLKRRANDQWAHFADEAAKAVAAAVPKKSLTMFAHLAGSGWPDSDGAVAVPKMEPEKPVSLWSVLKSPPDYSGFGGLALNGDTISYLNEAQPVRGVHVTVDSAGELERRSTITRTVAGGLAFGAAGAVVGALLRKKVDRRELYLLVDGPLYAWAVAVDPNHGAEARAFAAKVNSAAVN